MMSTSRREFFRNNRFISRFIILAWFFFLCIFIIFGKTGATSPSSSSSANPSSSKFRNHLDEFRTKGLRHTYFGLRHGQSLANVEKIICSNPEIATKHFGLSKKGNEQAENAGWELIEDFVNTRAYCQQNQIPHPMGIAICASDFLRAKETALGLVDAVRFYNQECIRKAKEAGKDRSSDTICLFTTDDNGHLRQLLLPDDDEESSVTVPIDVRLRERWFGDWDQTSDEHYRTSGRTTQSIPTIQNVTSNRFGASWIGPPPSFVTLNKRSILGATFPCGSCV